MSVFIHRNGERVELTGDELAAHQAQVAIDVAALAEREAAAAARQAERDARLTDVPANEQSIIALRDKVNQILAELRGE